ncbi:MAG: alpha/beta fold hydrolase [Alphaproteobacteria bacterium]|nr:alpha/beta fold hydrolase [Alphaproteobacteria bacterium]
MGRILLGLIAIVLVVIGLGYLALRRGDIPYETLEAKYANAHSEFVDLPSGVRMHFRDEGDGAAPPVLMIHGYSASLHTWDAWSAALGDDYHVLRLDLPGHGLTRAPDGYAASIEAFVGEVEAFVASQGLQKFTIVGSSMGGNVAWQYALAHPERTDALILVDASGWPDPRVDGGDGPVIFKLLRMPVVGPALLQLDSSAMVRQGLQASFFNPTLVDDAMLARYVEMGRAPGHREILLQMASLSDRQPATNELLSRIQIPTLILSGEADNLVPVASARQFAQAIAGSELVTWPNVGHIPQEEIPAESAAVVANFLGRVYRAEPSGEAIDAASAAVQAAQ